MLTDAGEVRINAPRDRVGSFDSKLVPKGRRRLEGFNDMVLSLVAKGMTMRDVCAHLADIYGVEVSPELISRITDSVWDELVEWQNRPLDETYPVLYVDALMVEVRDGGRVVKKPAYLAVGLDVTGHEHILGVWLGSGGEGASFWLSVLTELRKPRRRRRPPSPAATVCPVSPTPSRRPGPRWWSSPAFCSRCSERALARLHARATSAEASRSPASAAMPGGGRRGL